MKPIFTGKQLFKLLVPLAIEQFLAVAVGMADTLMIARVGEQAVSGVSIVDSINLLIIQVFAALATGGAVITSRLLGQKHEDYACSSANQLVIICVMISAVITVVSIIFNPYIITGIFGQMESKVYDYSRTYFYLTAFSFPFLAVYNACAALCRSMNDSKTSMIVAFIMNLINICGNAILIFVLGMEVKGAAISTLVSRIFACVIIFAVVLDKKRVVHFKKEKKYWTPNYIEIKRILSIGIPVAIENGLFQTGKLVIAGLISSFGTIALAANAVSNNIASLETLGGQSIGLALVTISGRCVGAGRIDEAKKYTKQMCGITIITHLIISVIISLNLRSILAGFNLSEETLTISYNIMMLHGIMSVIVWPFAFTLPNTLRAAMDAKYVMLISVFSMIFCRIALSYVFGIALNMGVFGTWVAMMCDWVVRSAFFIPRFYSRKWYK